MTLTSFNCYETSAAGTNFKQSAQTLHFIDELFNENVPFTLRLKIVRVLKLIREKINNLIFMFHKAAKPIT